MRKESYQLSAISYQPEKMQHSPRLRVSASPRHSSRGFTLMELMVSVAILLALLAMVGTIFSTASKAGGQAQALSTVYRQLANAAESIRRDLASMDPANDTLGIAGVAVQAKNKNDDPPMPPPAYHRADMLMLFTQRGDARPYVYKNFANPTNDFNQRSVVVYGHADVGQYNPVTNAMDTLQTIEPMSLPQIPAYNWHLGRRTMFIPNIALMPKVTMGVWNNSLDSAHPTTFVGLTSPYFLCGLADTLSAADLWPVSWLLGTSSLLGESGGYFLYNIDQTLQYAYFPMASGAYRYDPLAPAKSGVDCRWLYYEAATGFWYAYNPSAAPGLRWERTINGAGNTASPVQPSPPTHLTQGANRLLARYQTTSATNRMSLGRLLFYNNDYEVNRRAVIDPSPPTGTSELLANQFLPNCTDFRVEYTYDDPREVTLGFADPLNGANPIPPNSDFIRPINWRQVVSGQQIIWSRLSTLPATDRTDPHRWPRAIRITLKAVDAGGRLAEPVTYSIVHCWK